MDQAYEELFNNHKIRKSLACTRTRTHIYTNTRTYIQVLPQIHTLTRTPHVHTHTSSLSSEIRKTRQQSHDSVFQGVLTGGGGSGGGPPLIPPVPPAAGADPSIFPGATENRVWTLNLLGLLDARSRSACNYFNCHRHYYFVVIIIYHLS